MLENLTCFSVVITYMLFGQPEMIGGIIPNLIAFTLFLVFIVYFALTGKMKASVQ